MESRGLNAAGIEAAKPKRGLSASGRFAANALNNVYDL
jgi:hypothetical protein